MDLPYIALFCRGMFPPVLLSLRPLSGNWAAFSQRPFLHLIQLDFFVFKPIYRTYYLTFIDHTHIFKIKPTVSELINFYMCQYLICKYFTDNCASMFIQRCWPVAFILCVLPRLDITVMLLHTKSLKVVLLFCFFF